MAKSYADRNAESIAKTGKSLYERRIESAQARGFSKAQARGHARTQYEEKPISVVKTTPVKTTQSTKGTRGTTESKTAQVHKPKPVKPPKITQRFQRLSNGTRIVNTRSTNQIVKSLQKEMKGRGAGKLNRVYFQVWDNNTGKMVNVYYGRSGKKGFHGITVEDFLERVDAKMQSGDYDSFEDALWDTIIDDSSDNDYTESDGTGSNGSIPSNISQVSMYIRNS